MAKNAEASARRLARVRRSIKAAANRRPRLSVFRSSKQIYAQIIDDLKGATIVAASTIERDIREGLVTGADIAAARRIGSVLAERARKAGVSKVVFDRGSYMYHGRVKALAEAAREGGLEF